MRISPTTRSAIKIGTVLILLVVGVYLLVLTNLQRTLRRRLDELHAKGVPITFADVVPPAVPDKDNAAIVYRQAFHQLRLTDTKGGDSDCLKSFLRDEPSGSRQKLVSRVRQTLRRNKAALDLTRQATKRPRCRFPVDWGASEPSWKMFPHLDRLRKCARLVCAEAVIHRQDGDYRAAVESLRTALRIGVHASSEPTMNPWVTGVAIEHGALDALTDVLEHSNLGPNVYRSLAQDLRNRDLPTTYRRAFASELPVILWPFDAAEHEPRRLRKAWDSEEPGLDSVFTVYLSPPCKPLRVKDEIAAVALFQETLSVVASAQRDSAEGYRSLRARIVAVPTYRLITKIVFPMYARTTWSCERAEALSDGMQVVLALKAYHAEHRVYPEALTALRALPGWHLQPGALDGTAFVYRRQDAGFVLYARDAELNAPKWDRDFYSGDESADRGKIVLSGPPKAGHVVWKFEK